MCINWLSKLVPLLQKFERKKGEEEYKEMEDAVIHEWTANLFPKQ